MSLSEQIIEQTKRGRWISFEHAHDFVEGNMILIRLTNGKQTLTHYVAEKDLSVCQSIDLLELNLSQLGHLLDNPPDPIPPSHWTEFSVPGAKPSDNKWSGPLEKGNQL